MTKLFSDPEAIAEDIIREVGTRLVVGLPLGLGKANHIANALYARAVADRSIDLTFFSALTLEKPQPSNLLERRFIDIWVEGELSNYKTSAAGHLYFTLKDDRAQLPAVCFRNAARLLRIDMIALHELRNRHVAHVVSVDEYWHCGPLC